MSRRPSFHFAVPGVHAGAGLSRFAKSQEADELAGNCNRPMSAPSPVRARTGSVPRQLLSFELREIGVPPLRLLLAERPEIRPGEYPGVVEIVEGDAHRVVADRIEPRDRHVAL